MSMLLSLKLKILPRVVTADCVPILIYDKNDIVGCIHAGWKGAFSELLKILFLK